MPGHWLPEYFLAVNGMPPRSDRTVVPTGSLTSTIRVFVKALSVGTFDEYLCRVERDHTESLPCAQPC